MNYFNGWKIRQYASIFQFFRATPGSTHRQIHWESKGLVQESVVRQLSQRTRLLHETQRSTTNQLRVCYQCHARRRRKMFRCLQRFYYEFRRNRLWGIGGGGRSNLFRTRRYCAQGEWWTRLCVLGVRKMHRFRFFLDNCNNFLSLKSPNRNKLWHSYRCECEILFLPIWNFMFVIFFYFFSCEFW